MFPFIAQPVKCESADRLLHSFLLSIDGFQELLSVQPRKTGFSLQVYFFSDSQAVNQNSYCGLCMFTKSISPMPTRCRDPRRLESCIRQSLYDSSSQAVVDGRCVCVPASLHVLGNICSSWFTSSWTAVCQRLSVAAVYPPGLQIQDICIRWNFAQVFFREALPGRGISSQTKHVPIWFFSVSLWWVFMIFFVSSCWMSL